MKHLMIIAALSLSLSAQEETSKPADPLAYEIHTFEGGTIALFEGWKILPVQSNVFDMAPAGKESEFAVRIALLTPDTGIMDRLFEVGPQQMAQFLPGFRRNGQGRKCTFAGDEALLEEYRGRFGGRDITVRIAYVKRSDVAVIVAGVGTAEGFAKYGRSVEIVAQSITLQASDLENGLIGSWVWESTTSVQNRDSAVWSSARRVITLHPNGTFTDSSCGGTSAMGKDADQDTWLATQEGSGRGRIVKRGRTLTFHYDNGKTWSVGYALKGNNGLSLDGALYIKS